MATQRSSTSVGVSSSNKQNVVQLRQQTRSSIAERYIVISSTSSKHERLQRIDNGKSVQMSLGGHFKLSLKDCPARDCDVERMSKVPYANAVGSLMYLMVCTRPVIAYAVSVVSRYLANPGKNHWEAVEWILKYLRGTANVGLVYGTDRGNHVDVTGFVDSYYAKDPDKGRSITGYAFLVHGCVVSWKATLQHVVTLSTTEAEYMALTEVVNEAIYNNPIIFIKCKTYFTIITIVRGNFFRFITLLTLSISQYAM
ncbi:hypothetical protein Tco_1350551 [Tanacetum coccineum]